MTRGGKYRSWTTCSCRYGPVTNNICVEAVQSFRMYAREIEGQYMDAAAANLTKCFVSEAGNNQL